MTVILGAIARCLYIIGDILLFRFVFGYEFAKPAYRKVCGLMLLLGFVGVVKIYGTITSYILLFMGFKLLFMNIQLGILAFVFFAKNVFAGVVDGIIWYFNGNDIFWETIKVIYLIENIMYLVNIGILFYCKKIRKILSDSFVKKNIWIINSETLILCITMFTFYWTERTPAEDLYKVQALMYLKNSILGVLIIAVFLLFLLLNSKKEELSAQILLNVRCIKEQTEQYRMLSSKQEELRAFRHDVKGHLLVLQKMAKDNDTERVLQYLEANLAMQETIGYISSNNIIGDAIFNYYYDKAKKEGLKFEVLGKFADDFDIEETDLCVILTNVISNAYEAAVRCGTGSRVTVKISQFEQYTMIVVSNPVKEQPILENGIMKTTKADKENHGLGIKNTIKAVEKNNGQIVWKQECSKIFTEIIL